MSHNSSDAQVNARAVDDFLAGGGELGQLIREKDWSQTPLGPVETWPLSLKVAVRILLNSRYPMFVWWGRELTILYNDAYIPVHGAGHPEALGRSAPEIWASAWPVVGPQTDLVLNEGRATWNEAIQLTLERNGYPEETYFTFSYSPLSDDQGGVGGVFCACTEDTRRVLSERRLQTLRDLGEHSLGVAATVDQACHAAAATLAENPHDMPCGLIYLLDDNGCQACLVATVNMEAGTAASPVTVTLDSADDLWGFGHILATRQGQVVEHLEAQFGRLPAGPWADDWTRRALVLPLAKAGVQKASAGFLVAGISPRLALSDDYRSFLELAAGQLATALANVRAYAEERKRAEEALRTSEARQVFLLKLSDRLRTLTDARTLLHAAAELLGRYLGVSRAGYTEIDAAQDYGTNYDWTDGTLPSSAGRHRGRDWGPEIVAAYRRGEAWQVDDVNSDPRAGVRDFAAAYAALSIRATVAVPLLRGGRWVALIFVHHVAPRHWTADEVALLRDVGDRIWDAVERARAEAALREREAELARVQRIGGVAGVVIDVQHGLTGHRSPEYLRLHGLPPESKDETHADWLQRLHPDDRERADNVLRRALAGIGTTYRNEYRIIRADDGQERWISAVMDIERDADGQPVRLVGAHIDITERARAEVALRQSEERLRRMVNIAGVAVLTFDAASGTLIDANDAFLHMFGYSREEVAAHRLTWHTLTPPEYIAISEQQMQQLAETERIGPYEKEYLHKDGTRSWMLFAGASLGDGTVVEYCIDVSDRKRAEEALRASEARLHAIANLVPDLLWSSEPDGYTGWYNQRWLEYTGQTLDQATDRGWLDAIHPDDRDTSLRNFEQAVDAGIPLHQEHRLRRHDGEYRWFVVQALPLRDDQDRIIQWYGAATDIHAQRLALEAAQAAQADAEAARAALARANADLEVRVAARTAELVRINQTLEALINVAPLAIMTIDSQARVQRWNPAAAQLFGWSADEVIGQPLPTLPPDGPHADSDERRAARQGVTLHGLETQRRRKDGSLVDVSLWTAPLFDDAGHVSEAMALLADITTRKQTEAERAALIQRIITAQEDERRRIARELHDSLGQFLSALSLRLSLLQQMDGATPAVLEELGRLRMQVSQIDCELDRLTMELRPPALDDLGLADALYRYAEEWTLTTAIPVDVHASGLDGERLSPAIEATTYRIVQEALTNVLKHAHASAVSVIIERQPAELRVIFEDNGVGFNSQAFAGQQEGGRRLGLVGMVERATLVGGELMIESIPGEGTTIYLYIPLPHVLDVQGDATNE